MYDMVPMKRQPVMRHWQAHTYTAHDGRTTQSRMLQNAIIDLYGTNVFFGGILKGMSDGKYCTPFHSYDYVIVYSRPIFRKTGQSVEVGRVSFPIGS